MNNNIINTISVLTTNATINATGNGYGLILDSGVIYQKGFFQNTASQTIVVKDYDQNVADYVVGFTTVEEIWRGPPFLLKDPIPEVINISVGIVVSNPDKITVLLVLRTPSSWFP